jgi:DNA-binding GntR family transcriptional regulator
MIDHDAGEPVYLQLAAILRAAILSGEIAGRLPSEQSLMQEHGVSRGTASHAVRLLREEGLARMWFGRGTFVVPEDERP